MSIDEAIQKLDTLISVYDEEMTLISEELAVTAKSLITHRIQSEGIGRQYSTNGVPAYFYTGFTSIGKGKSYRGDSKKLNAGFDRLIEQKLSEEDPEDRYVTWSEIRRAQGLQIAFVDLTYSGRMFQNVGVIATEKRGDTFVTIVGGFTQEVRDKLRWNAQRYGDFFAVNEKERQLLDEVFANRLQSLYEKHLS